MKYIIEFWNPWASQWQRWNMEPVEAWDAELMIFSRRQSDKTFRRRSVKA